MKLLKAKRPTMPTLGHTVYSGVIAGLLRRRSVVGRKGYLLLRRLISLRANDPVSLHADDARELYATEDVELCSR